MTDLRPRFPVRFDEALGVAQEFVREHAEQLGDPIVLVRDLFGRIRLAITGEHRLGHSELARVLHQSLGNYSPGEKEIFLYRSDLFDPDAVFESPDALSVSPLLPGHKIRVLDRQITGHDWLRTPLQKEAHPPRATLFGIKGGVGRSTALVVWSWRLARAGKKVLILDMDLESPGVTTTLLSQENRPRFGIVDWMVEDGVDQADETLLDDIVGTSALARESEGLIRVVPAAGYEAGDYLAKLARSYTDSSGSESEGGFAERISRMLKQLEERERPDIVLIDSRAGLHDIAAVAITRLDAVSLLFGVHTSQTWEGYRLLFKHWRQHPEITQGFRNNLQMVAALVPETHISSYIEGYREAAYQLFLDNLYEITEPDATDSFNFNLNDSDAPHYPLRINWGREFQEFDPVRDAEAVTESQLDQGYGEFVERATQLLLGESLR